MRGLCPFLQEAPCTHLVTHSQLNLARADTYDAPSSADDCSLKQERTASLLADTAVGYRRRR